MYPGAKIILKKNRNIPEELRGKSGEIEQIFDRGRQFHLKIEKSIILATKEDFILCDNSMRELVLQKLYKHFIDRGIELCCLEEYIEYEDKVIPKYMEWSEVLDILKKLSDKELLNVFEYTIIEMAR